MPPKLFVMRALIISSLRAFIFTGSVKTSCLLSKLRFTYYNVQYNILFKVVYYGIVSKCDFLLVGNSGGAS